MNPPRRVDPDRRVDSVLRLYEKSTCHERQNSLTFVQLVQPQFVTMTQFVTISATYHNWSHNMSQLTHIITLLTQNVTMQERNLSQEFQIFCNMSQRDIERLRSRYLNQEHSEKLFIFFYYITSYRLPEAIFM